MVEIQRETRAPARLYVGYFGLQGKIDAEQLDDRFGNRCADLRMIV
jgi:hypothetical protein